MTNIMKIGAKISIAAFACGIALLIAANRSNEPDDVIEVVPNDIEADDKQAEIGKLWEESIAAYTSINETKKEANIDTFGLAITEGILKIAKEGGKINVNLEGFSGTYATPLNSDYIDVAGIDMFNYSEPLKEISMDHLEKILENTSTGRAILLKDTIISEGLLNQWNRQDKEEEENIWSRSDLEEAKERVFNKGSEELKKATLITLGIFAITGALAIGIAIVSKKIEERKRKKMKEVEAV